MTSSAMPVGSRAGFVSDEKPYFLLAHNLTDEVSLRQRPASVFEACGDQKNRRRDAGATNSLRSLLIPRIAFYGPRLAWETRAR